MKGYRTGQHYNVPVVSRGHTLLRRESSAPTTVGQFILHHQHAVNFGFVRSGVCCKASGCTQTTSWANAPEYANLHTHISLILHPTIALANQVAFVAVAPIIVEWKTNCSLMSVHPKRVWPCETNLTLSQPQ